MSVYMYEFRALEEKVKKLEETINKMAKQLNEKTDGDYKFPCNHQTIPFGVNKRKCGICGEIFVVDSN